MTSDTMMDNILLLDMCRGCLKTDCDLTEYSENPDLVNLDENSAHINIVKYCFPDIQFQMFQHSGYKLCDVCSTLLEGAQLLREKITTSEYYFQLYLEKLKINKNEHSNNTTTDSAAHNVSSTTGLEISELYITLDTKEVEEYLFPPPISTKIAKEKTRNFDEDSAFDSMDNDDNLDDHGTASESAGSSTNSRNSMNEIKDVDSLASRLSPKLSAINKIKINGIVSKIKQEPVNDPENSAANDNSSKNPPEVPTIAIDEEPKRFPCNQCHMSFQYRSQIKKHKQRHLRAFRHVCEYCKKMFKQKDSFERHLLMHTGERNFKCNKCDKSYFHEAALRKHLDVHGEKPFHCTYCPRRFTYESAVKFHEQVHRTCKPYKCTICKKGFKRKDYLKIHQKRHLNKKTPAFGGVFACKDCGKRFARAKYLNIHERRHADGTLDANGETKNGGGRRKKRPLNDGVERYVCKYCNKPFSNVHAMARHETNHTKPYICNYCNRAFGQKASLTFHETIHTGVKRFKCDIDGCEIAFARPSYLKRHKASHFSDRPFVCEICNKSYKTRTALYTHKKKHFRKWEFFPEPAEMVETTIMEQQQPFSRDNLLMLQNPFSDPSFS